MIPITQTVLHDPANGKYGNCLSAVLASLLHLPIESVPVFFKDTWLQDLNEWLRQYGLAYICFSIADDGPQFLASFGITGLHHELAGPSPRNTEVAHALVGHDGRAVFDPHPSRAGVAALNSCGVFVALEPWKWSRA